MTEKAPEEPQGIPYEAVRDNPAVSNATGTLIEEVGEVQQGLRAFLSRVNTAPLSEVSNILVAVQGSLTKAIKTSGQAVMVEQFILAELSQQASAETKGNASDKDKPKKSQPKKAARKPAAKKTTKRKGR